MSAAIYAVLARASVAQEDTLTLDLAAGTGSDTVRIGPGVYRVRVVNRVPGFYYAAQIEKRAIAIPPIDMKEVMGPEPERAVQDTERKSCEQLLQAIGALGGITKEEEMPGWLQRVASARAAEGGTKACSRLADAADSLSKLSVTVHWAYTMKRGEYLIVTVSRAGVDAQRRTWRRVFSTGPRGEWRFTYGFGVVFGAPKSYSAKEATDGSFVITEDASRSSLQVSPAVFLAFAPAGDRVFVWWPPRITVGLGLDLSEPVLYLGWGVTYNANLHLSIGGSLRRESALLGKYSPGEEIKTNLSSAELHEKVFTPRVYASISLRFTSNPFKKPAAIPEEQ